MLWNKLPDRTAERLLTRLYEQPKKLFGAIITVARPSFYRQGEIIHLLDDNGAMLVVAAGKGDLAERELFILTGKSGDIREANDAAGLAITAENALDYLSFFCTALKANGHVFHVIESLEGLRLGNCSHTPADLTMQVTELPGDTYAFKGYVQHGRVLFAAEFQLSGSGMVQMLRDEYVGELRRDWP